MTQQKVLSHTVTGPFHLVVFDTDMSFCRSPALTNFCFWLMKSQWF